MTVTEKVQMADSKERVALDLALRVAGNERTPDADYAREYWLTLYQECRRVVFGHSPKKED